MEIQKMATAGTLESSNCLVTVEAAVVHGFFILSQVFQFLSEKVPFPFFRGSPKHP